MNQIYMNFSKSLDILYQDPLHAYMCLSQQLEVFQEVAWKKKKKVLKTWCVKTLGRLVCWPLPEWRFLPPTH